MTNLPSRFGVLLFPAFQALDVFGTLDSLNLLSLSRHMELSLISSSLDPVSTKPRSAAMNQFNSSFGESIVPTHTFDTAPLLDVLIVPGGMGTRASPSDLAGQIQYIRDVYPSLQYLVTICTGAMLAAQAGVLDGKRATSNKRAWQTVTPTGPHTYWVAHARWVQDGNVWSSSGVSAGIDAMLAWIATVYGESTANGLADGMEYTRAADSSDDPFAAVYNCTDVPPSR